MRRVAFHSHNFANFMYIEFDGRVIGADLSAVPPAHHIIEFGDQDVWLNMAVPDVSQKPLLGEPWSSNSGRSLLVVAYKAADGSCNAPG